MTKDSVKQSSIQVVVRIRPFTRVESLKLEPCSYSNNPTGGNGNMSLMLNDESMILMPTDNSGSFAASSLNDQWKFRPDGVKKIVDCVDDKMLIFDPQHLHNTTPLQSPLPHTNTLQKQSTSSTRKISAILLNNPQSLNNLNFIESGNENVSPINPKNKTPNKRQISISKKPFSPQSPINNSYTNNNADSNGNNTSPILPRRRKTSLIDYNSNTQHVSRRVASPTPSLSSLSSYRQEHKFIFDRVFDEDATQNEVYEYTTKPLLGSILQGYNCTIFAYGATGCGKTYTINGDPAAASGSADRTNGIVYKSIQDLFIRLNNLRDEENKEYELTMSYLEIYNETIKDLLSPQTASNKLVIREDSEKKIQVSNLSYHKPETLEDIMDLISLGNSYRTQNETEANKTSSRSHSVLQISVVIKDKNLNDNLSENQLSSVLSIIDLAGSERACKTKNRGERLQEGANINRSLLALGNCINALCNQSTSSNNSSTATTSLSANENAPNQPHIPYRDSKLTRLLKFSLGGNCKTVMIVCCSPSSEHYDETLNTLKYANRAKEIKTKILRNSTNMNQHVGSYLKIIENQRLKIKKLKKLNDISLQNTREKINLEIFEIINGIQSRLNSSKKFEQFKFKRSLILCKRRFLQMLILNFQQLLSLAEYSSVSSNLVAEIIQQTISKLYDRIEMLETQYEAEEHLVDSYIDYENVILNLPLNIDSYNEVIDLPIVESLIKGLREVITNEILTNSIIMNENLIKDHHEFFMIPHDFMVSFIQQEYADTVFSDKLKSITDNIDTNFEHFSSKMYESLFGGENNNVQFEPQNSSIPVDKFPLEAGGPSELRPSKKKIRWSDMENDLDMGHYDQETLKTPLVHPQEEEEEEDGFKSDNDNSESRDISVVITEPSDQIDTSNAGVVKVQVGDSLFPKQIPL